MEALHRDESEATAWEKRLGRELLRDVSRSFYLSLRLLPGRMRGPLSLAYLLARASDTLADTAAVDVERRLHSLERYSVGLTDQAEAQRLQEELRETFLPLQDNPAEQQLLDRLTECFSWYHAMSAFHRTSIADLLKEILEGQCQDCQQFGNPGSLHSLATAEELDRYAYLVAGSVGAFWDRLGHHHWKSYAKEPEDEMRRLGINYGKGLQLLNILRDFPQDIANGRCYLPKDELDAKGIELPGDLNSEMLREVMKDWEKRCASYLDDGLRYCLSVNRWRVRFPTALPAILGIRTLALMREAKWESRMGGVKITRTEVKHLLRQTALASVSRQRLERLYKRLQQAPDL